MLKDALDLINARNQGDLLKVALWLQSRTHVDERISGLKTILKDKPKCAAIHYLALNGPINMVEMALRLGSDINTRDSLGYTPLHHACASFGSTTEMVSFLLNNGADVNAVGNHGTTPLHVACRYTEVGIIDTLIKHGSRVDVCDVRGDQPIHIATHAGDMAMVSALLDYGADVNAVARKSLVTPLYVALSRRQIEMARLLVSRGAKTNLVTSHGVTPLMCALHINLNIIDELGLCTPSIINAQNDKGDTALHIAVSSGYVDRVEYLLKHGSDPNGKNNDGNTPLHLVASQGNQRILKLLLQAKSDPNIRNNKGKTPLNVARSGGFDYIMVNMVTMHELRKIPLFSHPLITRTMA